MKVLLDLPDEFEEVATKFLLSPDRLAYLLCADFAFRPPRRLIVVERAERASHPVEMAALDQKR